MSQIRPSYIYPSIQPTMYKYNTKPPQPKDREADNLCFVLRLLFIERNAKERIIRMSGPQCCSNPPTLNPNAGAGHVEQLGGLSTYVSGSPNSKLAILLITDVFGTHLPTHFFHTSLLWLLYFSLQTVISSGCWLLGSEIFENNSYIHCYTYACF